MTAIIGPLETDPQARELPAVRAIYQAMHASRRRGVMAERNAALLDEACVAAGVQRGTYDFKILAWLAGGEPETAAVVAGLIGRAYQAGTADGYGPDDPIPYTLTVEGSGPLLDPDCRADQHGSCADVLCECPCHDEEDGNE